MNFYNFYNKKGAKQKNLYIYLSIYLSIYLFFRIPYQIKSCWNALKRFSGPCFTLWFTLFYPVLHLGVICLNILNWLLYSCNTIVDVNSQNTESVHLHVHTDSQYTRTHARTHTHTHTHKHTQTRPGFAWTETLM